VSRLIQAFGASAGSVVTQTIMRESFSGVTGAKVFARTSAAMALAPALGPLIGGVLQTYWGFRSVFSGLVTLAVVVGGYAWWRLPETQPASDREATVSQIKVIKRLVGNPVVWASGLLIGGSNGILFSYYAEAPFIFMSHFGFSAVQYGWLGLVLAAASLLGAILVNRLLTWWLPEQLTLWGLWFSVVSALTFVLTAYGEHPGLILVSVFLTFLGLNIALPNALNQALVGYEDVMGSASGWFSLGYYLLVSGMTFGMSCLHNGAITTLPWYVLGLSVVMLVVYVKVVPRRSRAVEMDD